MSKYPPVTRGEIGEDEPGHGLENRAAGTCPAPEVAVAYCPEHEKPPDTPLRGAYAVGILPVSDAFDLHARVGYQISEVDTPLGDADDDGLGYGVGAQWNLSPSFGVRADWTRMDGDEGDDDAISLGGVMNF